MAETPTQVGVLPPVSQLLPYPKWFYLAGLAFVIFLYYSRQSTPRRNQSNRRRRRRS